MPATADANADGGDEEPLDKDDESDHGLTIIEDLPTPKKKRKTVTVDKDVLDFESDIDKLLDEKAAKSNLKDGQVKNILKHVVTNEDVLAFLLQAEKETDEQLPPTYEPKYTRAKAKELSHQPAHDWAKPVQEASETHLLVNEELAEDSSGEEYIPGEEESEDEHDSTTTSKDSSFTEPCSLSASTSTQTVWSEDGVFKIPAVDEAGKIAEPNIALRTRSKLCLSDTPLEVIEEAFIPPDITTDMYDMECDDDDWKNFLKEFTRPLNEVQEDEDQDPEYNILADEEIDKIDKEELRADKAVNITRKELNALMAELFDYADSFSKEAIPAVKPKEVTEQESVEAQETAIGKIYLELIQVDQNPFQENQKLLLDQQMRQHVQLAIQNFLLTHQHPQYDELSKKFKIFLLDLGSSSETNENSCCNAINLQPALKLVSEWEQKFKTGDSDVVEYKAHVNQVLYNWKQAKNSGALYIGTFPKYLLDIVSKSPVFIYPQLLPRIPFKNAEVMGKTLAYTHSEDELIALALEQFIPFLKLDPRHMLNKTSLKMTDLCHYIIKYAMPCRSTKNLHLHIKNSKYSVDLNPIKHYYQFGRKQPTMHYVVPIERYKMLPPCERPPEELPEQWRTHMQPVFIQRPKLNLVPIATLTPIFFKPKATKVTKPPPYNKTFKRKRKPPKPDLKKGKPIRNSNISSCNCTASEKPQKSVNVTDAVHLTSDDTLITSSDGNRIVGSLSSDDKLCRDLTTSVGTSTVGKRDGNVTSFNGNHSSEAAQNSSFGSVTSEAAKQFWKCLDKHYQSTPKKLSISENLLAIKFNSSIFSKLHRTEDKMMASMPSLSTPARCSPDTTVDFDLPQGSAGEQEAQCSIEPSCGKVKTSEEADEKLNSSEDGESVKDNLDDINALMVASSTLKHLSKKRPTCAEKKKAKMIRDFTANLRMLSAEDDEAASEKTDRFVQAYYDKVEEQLNPADHIRFLEVLNNYEESRNTYAELYDSVADILHQKHPELLDEFLCFYTNHQAKKMGKLMPYMILQRMSLFLRKLELFFKDQPSHVRKIYRAITELNTSEDITLTHVKNTILPLLKGNGLLMDWFLQIFPEEKPTSSLLNGPWENVEIGRESAVLPEEVYETITVPETEDPYGGTNCICHCHSVDNGAFKSRSIHCIPCGTKFLQGRVFVQTGRGLRLAKITFDDNSVDHMARLACRTKVKRSESIALKQISPSKESQDDTKLSSDEEPDKKRRVLKTAKKRKPRRKKVCAVPAENKSPPAKPVVDVVPACGKTETVTKKDGSDQNTENTSDSSVNEIKQATEENFEESIEENVEESIEENIEESIEENIEDNIEWDCNTSIESIELKLTPEHPSAESESEFCEETSQDNNTDSEASGGESESNSPDINCQWTRDEDKTILETFQKVEDKEMAFKQIAQRLEHRTLSQIRLRFELLINLLKKMSRNS